jgi:bifunctional DNA-binding transcriptional regulator/antitoxin component of YhaV-PrlF toxin-antitoxin module
MIKVINISDQGTLTLPKKMRCRLGVARSGQVIAEETDEGILLRPGVTFPVELYSERRLAEFRRNNDKSLVRFRFKKKEVFSDGQPLISGALRRIK